MIQLSKKDTYTLVFDELKYEAIKRRYKYKTLHRWWCLQCGKEIFVTYEIETHVHVFCDDPECNSFEKNDNTILIQTQYLKRLKDSQLKLIEAINENSQFEL